MRESRENAHTAARYGAMSRSTDMPPELLPDEVFCISVAEITSVWLSSRVAQSQGMSHGQPHAKGLGYTKDSFPTRLSADRNSP